MKAAMALRAAEGALVHRRGGGPVASLGSGIRRCDEHAAWRRGTLLAGQHAGVLVPPNPCCPDERIGAEGCSRRAAQMRGQTVLGVLRQMPEPERRYGGALVL